MRIKFQQLPEQNLKPLFEDSNTLGFCKYFTDYMFTMNYTEEDGWHNPTIKPFTSFEVAPSSLVLHYAQEIFEGLKAFKGVDGKIRLFRPDMNAKRFNRSAERLCMPNFLENDFLESIHALVYTEQRWIPSNKEQPYIFAHLCLQLTKHLV